MSLLLGVAGLPRSTYYYYTKKQKEPDKYAELREEICAIVAENKGRYGYRRVTQELRNRGFQYNHKLVMKLMKQMGLSSKVRMKKYRSRAKLERLLRICWKEISTPRSQTRNGSPM